MSLRFIIGRAGTGKTERCLEEIRGGLKLSPQGNPLVLLVPEQATFQMEYALAKTEGLEGMLRAQILSFRRLAWRIFQETGGAARVPIGELGKRMVLRSLLEDNKGEISVFARSVDKPGFADALARSIGELKIYSINPEDIKEALGTLEENTGGMPGLLPGKLHDLYLIYTEFEKFLSGRYTDPDDYLNHLTKCIPNSAIISEAEFWVDGFTGFTPQEFGVLEQLMTYAKRVNITLCLDPDLFDQLLKESDLFYPTWETSREVRERAQRRGIEMEPTEFLKPRIPPRFIRTSLACIEKGFFSYPLQRNADASGITLAAAVSRRAEVEAAAREIYSLCKDQGYRWRECTVLLRDLGPYKNLIVDIFNDYHIPFFIDSKRDMLHHPLVELIRSGLESVVKDWAYEPLFRCLKTDLLPLNREETDLLENYVLAHGLRGVSRWQSGPWNFRHRYTLGEEAEISAEEGLVLDKINESREKVLDSLAHVTREVGRATTVRAITTALYHWLERLDVPGRLQNWAIQISEEGNPGASQQAREHHQVWGAVMGLFDEMVEAIGEEETSPEIYLNILESGLQSLTLGMIPPSLDHVVVGTMERTRASNSGAVLILGATEGILPARIPDDGMFNDAERERLANAGLIIATGSRRKAFDEQYLIYSALTRARDCLWIGYPLADDEGRALNPSPIVRRIKEMFPAVPERLFQVEIRPEELQPGDEGYFAYKHRVQSYIAAGLRELKAGRSPAPLWWDLYNSFIISEGGEKQIAAILEGVFQTNEEKKLPKGLTRKLYGQPMRASVSRIEKFNACPFAHFASYGLKLRERPHFKLAAPDMGEFFHAALKLFDDRLTYSGKDWGALSPTECSELTRQIVEELAPQLQSEILLSTARYRYLKGKLKQNLNRAAMVLAEHSRRSSFRPIGVELQFGPGAPLPSVRIPLPGGDQLELVGRIDRVDAAKLGDVLYLRVIDYKSSDNSINVDEVFHGLRLQLLTYLHVALTHSELLLGTEGLPGAVLYFTVREPVISASGPLTSEILEKEILKKLKMKGLVLADPEVVRGMDNQLLSGYSELLPVALNRDGGFYSNASVASLENFNCLRSHLEAIFARVGAEMLGGTVNIEPYKYKNLTACTFCSFRAVCQFDQLFEINKIRNLKKLSAAEVWALMAERGSTDERAPMD